MLLESFIYPEAKESSFVCTHIIGFWKVLVYVSDQHFRNRWLVIGLVLIMFC